MKWISADTPPLDGEEVLVLYENEVGGLYWITDGWYNRNQWERIDHDWNETIIENVKYWMPVPELPEEYRD